MEKEKYFDKFNCLKQIRELRIFYEKDNFKLYSDKETNLLKNVIESCHKEKCPPGYYSLYGECLYG